MNTVIVGAQWGDEGKGKIIDILSARQIVLSGIRVAATPAIRSWLGKKNLFSSYPLGDSTQFCYLLYR